MKITVTVSRKHGRPNYGSEGAGCEITLEVPEKTASSNPDALVAEIRRAYSLADAAVTEQLARSEPQQQPAAAVPAPVEPARQQPAAPAHNGNGNGNGSSPPTSAEPFDYGERGRPENGRQAYAWAQRVTEETGQNTVDYIKGLAAHLGLSTQVTTWTEEQAAEVFDLVEIGFQAPYRHRGGKITGRTARPSRN